MPRPTKLTPEVQAKLVDMIANGSYYEIACRCVGINYATFRRWIRQGAKDDEGEFCEFRDAIKRAQAECEHAMVVEWKGHMPGNWQAIATFLERRHPERWSKDRLKLKEIEQRIKDLERVTTESDKQNNRL